MLRNKTSQACYFLLISKKPSILWNGLSLRKHSPSTTSEPLLKVGSNYSTAALQAAYKTTAGPPTSFNSVEEFDKAALYRHTSLFYVLRY